MRYRSPVCQHFGAISAYFFFKFRVHILIIILILADSSQSQGIFATFFFPYFSS